VSTTTATAATVLAEIEGRAEGATGGPWEAFSMDSGHSRYEMSRGVITPDVGDSICDMDGLARASNERHAKDDGAADAAFIAHARTDVPAMAKALRAVLALADDPIETDDRRVIYVSDMLTAITAALSVSEAGK